MIVSERLGFFCLMSANRWSEPSSMIVCGLPGVDVVEGTLDVSGQCRLEALERVRGVLDLEEHGAGDRTRGDRDDEEPAEQEPLDDAPALARAPPRVRHDNPPSTARSGTLYAS